MAEVSMKPHESVPDNSSQQSTIPKKNHKSRNGCLTCKKKRLKCDETKPQCLNCQKRGVECGGYSTTFKWKSFEETSASQRVRKVSTGSSMGSASALQPAQKIKRSMSVPDKVFDEALQQASLSIAGKSPDELALQNELMKLGKNPHSKLPQLAEEQAYITSPAAPSASVEFTTSSLRHQQQKGVQQQGRPHPSSPAPAAPATTAEPQQQHTPLHPQQHQHSLQLQQSQPQLKKRRVSSIIAPSPPNMVPSPGPIQDIPSPSLSTIVRSLTDFDQPLPGNIPSPNMESFYPKLYELDSDAVEEGPSSSHNVSGMKRSLSVDSALAQTTIPEYRRELISYSQALSPKLPTIHLPQFDISNLHLSNTGFDRVFQAFDKYTCAIMSIRDGPTENPWRTLMWPLAMQNSVLFKSLAAMALFHIARGDTALRNSGITYMRQSMSELAEGLVNNSIPNDVALATCLTLAITDSWDKHTTAGIAHLKGAKSIINKLDKEAIQKNSKLYKFLINSFLYYDVLSRMSSSQLLDSDYDENGKLIKNLSLLKCISARELSPGADDDPKFNPMSPLFDESVLNGYTMDNDCIIDPLLGCARGLFFIIGRVASFIARVRNMKKLSLSTVSKAVALKQEIESWRPDANIRQCMSLEDPLCDISSCIATAEAYRFSTLLYLEQAVPEISSQSSADLGEKVLMLLASIPTTSKTCLLHMFPLLVASCEITDPDDRAWIDERWKVLSQRMWLGTVDKAVEVVHEVWRRKDAAARASNASTSSKSSNALSTSADWDLFQGRIDVLNGSKKRETEGINSPTHWSSVMKDWNWEVLFA